MAQPALTLVTRVALAFACLFQVLFDAQFATQVLRLRGGARLPADGATRAHPTIRGSEPEPSPASAPPSSPPPSSPPPSSPPPSENAAALTVQNAEIPGALVLLGLLQREGRLIDFLEQDIADFDDEEIGAAARQVHEGCRRVLHGHSDIQPLRDEAEDTTIDIPAGYAAAELKLSGKVAGDGPYRGKLVHRGWRIIDLSLPQVMAGHDVAVVAPAEVEVA